VDDSYLLSGDGHVDEMHIKQMKQMIVGTNLGRFAVYIRDRLEIVQAAVRSPESVGTVANDHLATFLVTRLCQPGKTFIDVGAHIGSIVSEVLCHCASVNIIAVEAMPDKASRLRGVSGH
jgi:hypothetical protein